MIARSRSAVDIQGKVLIFATNVAGGSHAPAVVLAARAALQPQVGPAPVGHSASKG